MAVNQTSAGSTQAILCPSLIHYPYPIIRLLSFPSCPSLIRYTIYYLQHLPASLNSYLPLSPIHYRIPFIHQSSISTVIPSLCINYASSQRLAFFFFIKRQRLKFVSTPISLTLFRMLFRVPSVSVRTAAFCITYGL